MTKGTIEKPWAQWYGLQRWRNRSDLQKKLQPLCEMCLNKGETVAAEVADHIIPHHGNYRLFWFGKLQSLCASHHSGDKQILERGGVVKDYRIDIGGDGWPIDSKHPVYKRTFGSDGV